MTADEYRNRGMSCFLMKKIMDEWKERCDAIYLFADIWKTTKVRIRTDTKT